MSQSPSSRRRRTAPQKSVTVGRDVRQEAVRIDRDDVAVVERAAEEAGRSALRGSDSWPSRRVSCRRRARTPALAKHGVLLDLRLARTRRSKRLNVASRGSSAPLMSGYCWREVVAGALGVIPASCIRADERQETVVGEERQAFPAGDGRSAPSLRSTALDAWRGGGPGRAGGNGAGRDFVGRCRADRRSGERRRRCGLRAGAR